MTSPDGHDYFGTRSGGYDYFASPAPSPAAAVPVPAEQPDPTPGVAPEVELNRFGLPVTPAGAVPVPGPVPSEPHGLQAHEVTQLLTADPAGFAKAMGGGGAYPTQQRRLGFRRNLSAGFELCQTTGRILARQPRLLGVTFVSLLVGVAMVVGYAALFGGLDALMSGGRFVVAVKTFPLLAATSIVGALGQAVVVGTATMVFEDGRGDVGKAWGKALARLPQLALWGVVFAAERTITGMLRRGRAGRLAADVIDIAWDFATYLAIPVILFENVSSPFQAVKRSALLVRTRWGVQAVAQGAIFVALFVGALPLVFLSVLIGVKVSVALGVALFVFVYVSIVVVASTLGGILSAAMYRFAITGLTSPGFVEGDLWAAFGGRPFGSLSAGGFA